MSEWVRLCGADEVPVEGGVCEQEVAGRQICLAHVAGELKAVDNLCPHRQGPLGQGWIEGNAVVCPWHSWAFDVTTGLAEYPQGERVGVYPVRLEGGEVQVEFID